MASKPQGQTKASLKRTNVCMGGKGEKLLPKKFKVESIPKDPVIVSSNCDLRNGNSLLSKMGNVAQDVIHFVPNAEWDNMLANNGPAVYMTNDCINNGNENALNGSSTQLYTETSVALNNIQNALRGSNARLYAQSTFALNKSQTKWISLGLCADLHFEPVVKLMGKGQCITLTETEWKTLVFYRNVITSSFAGYGSTPSYHEVCGVKITTEWMDKAKKVLKMQRAEETIFLAYDSVHEMWKLCDLITSRLELLKKLEYKRYYDSVIDTIMLMKGDVKENIMGILAKSGASEHVCVTKELLIFAMDKILLDSDLREHVRV